MNSTIIKPLFIFATLAIASVVTFERTFDEKITHRITTVDDNALTFAVGKAAKFSTSINGRSHQQTPITSFRGFQYATWYDATRNVCVGRRQLPDGPWEIIRLLDHKIQSNDAHNTVVIGICHKDGTIHLAFDHHATELNYRVSAIGAATDPQSTQWSTELFGEIQHSLGAVKTEERVTYPRFFNAPNGNLMLYYRSKTSADGDGMIEEYDGEKHQWSPGLGKFISKDIGTFSAGGKTSLARCPYMNDLCYAGDRLHASWIWRDRFKKTQSKNQHDLCYVYSDDHGRTWCNSNGEVIGKTNTDFIHLDSPGLVVAPIPIGSGITNQNTQYAYPDGRVHIVARQRDDAVGEGRYRHWWRDSDGKWHNEPIPFTGKRPKLLGDSERSLLLVFNTDDEDMRIVRGTPNSDRSSWQWSRVDLPFSLDVIGEPMVDYARWEQESGKVLSIYCQREPTKLIETNQPGPVDGAPSPLHVLDLSFASERMGK
ncbi:BNR repeat-containing protein [Mariniblastus fucicola]|uniref:BNR/Asp-box repeat protein n=1 Tax=Mariniblastus fucicola TaxID=980251 RepID=A0A5B9P875_9BACT|nr:BNR repeat-containing protein [Mariniblastus fucicola]QEG22897.1 hypothetical protein MFFC18_27850 [Mariniblastus fucicola]